ncbi:MAG: hypothetical protein EXR12_15040 [Rhodospirillaceae bacterium]|nr:hypothetical protein [Rhodospirillaceae bacterium]
MARSIRAVLLTSAIALMTVVAYAESPIPETRVPGFGGNATGSGAPGGSPSSSGSNVGSNVGAGATAGPSNDIIAPATSTTDEAVLPPPTGTFGPLTITK